MKSVVFLISLGLMLTAGSATAQPFDARSEAEAHALAAKATEYLASQHGAAGLAVFEDVTDGLTPALRHVASGAICRLWASYGAVYAEDTPFFDRVALGDAITCTTYADYDAADGPAWEIATRIERADLALRGRRYHGFDGEQNSGMDWVTPAYVARRGAFWWQGRSGPVRRMGALAAVDGTGAPVEAFGYRTQASDGRFDVQRRVALVQGWLVQVDVRSRPSHWDAAERMSDGQIVRLVSTIDRPAPGLDALPSTPVMDAQPAGYDPILSHSTVADARRIVDAFQSACLTSGLAGRPFREALDAGATFTPETPPTGLPHVAPDRPLVARRMSGEGVETWVHLEAIVGGDCAVSAYGLDGDVLAPEIVRMLTTGDAPPFAKGWVNAAYEPVMIQGFDGDGWPGGGVLIVNRSVEGLPALTLGIAPP
ncbi:MAG: hypothetical protein V4701_02600 [Pseudomonadota bacterium]